MDVVFLLGIAVGIVSVLLMAWQVRLQRIVLLEDREERTAQSERRRATLLAALHTELQAIRSAADADLSAYSVYNLSNPRAASRATEGEVRYRLSFVWTPLLCDTIEEAINEAALLRLMAPQIDKLQGLRGRILRVNTLVNHKASLFPALMQAEPPREIGYGERHWAEDKAVVLNNEIERESRAIVPDCDVILGWWRSDDDEKKK